MAASVTIACVFGGYDGAMSSAPAPDDVAVAKIVDVEEDIALIPHPTGQDADGRMLFLAPDASKALQLVHRHRFQAFGFQDFTFTLAETARRPGRSWMDMPEVVATLPQILDEPRIYLSAAQAGVCANYPTLSHLVLPGWVKLSLVADALGYGQAGINLALQHTQQVPWLWATEFENVHTTWRFVEPRITIYGQQYADSEAYYKAEKWKLPISAAVIWDAKKVEVMTRAVTAKFQNSEEVRQLLISTHPFPLLSIKNDPFWGFDARQGGQNMLAVILMDLRQKYVNGE